MINFCWSLFRWCLLLGLAAALATIGYLYFWLDDEIRRQVEHLVAARYPGLAVHVGRARFEQDRGIAIYDITLEAPHLGDDSPPMLAIEEMYLAGHVRMDGLITGRLPIEEIIVRRSTLRVARQADGRWDAQALLPVPRFGDESPGLKIEDATLVVSDATRTASAAQTVQGIDLTITPVKAEPVAGSAPQRFRVEGVASGVPAREMRVQGEIGTVDGYLNLTLTAAGMEVSSELIAALPGLSPVELRGAELSGRADATVQINRPAADAPPNWSAEVRIARGRLVHAMLPDPLTEVTCTLRAGPQRLFIERFNGRCGSATVALSAERAGWSANAPLALAARAVGLRVDDRLCAMLPESYARMWNRFRPVGLVDAELRLTFDGREWRPQLAATCRSASLTDAEKFPYVLDQVTGQVEYQPAGAAGPDKLRLNLTGNGGGRPVRIDAELTQLAPGEPEGMTIDEGVASLSSRDASRQVFFTRSVKTTLGYRGVRARGASHSRPHPVGWVEISGSDVPLHEQLIVALPEKGERLVRSLRAQGAVDFRFRAEWKDVSQPRADVTQEIRLKDCAIQYAEFPFPLRRVAGLVTAQNWRWTIHDVEGRGGNESTLVKCSGEAAPRGDGWHADLSFQAINVPLDDNLRLALSAAAQHAWAELRPQGRIDFNAHVVHDTAQPKPLIEVTLAPRDRSVSLELAAFPYRLEQFEGVATWKAGRVELRNLIARHDRAVYSAAAGTWEPTPDGGWQFALTGFNADRLTPHRDLFVALPPRLQTAIERLQPSGTFGLYNSQLSFASSPQAQRIVAAWDVNLDCHQAVIRAGLPVQNITGGIHLVGRDDGRTCYAAGELALDSLVMKDMQFTNIRGPLWVDAARCLFGESAAQMQGQPPQRITADAYGGSLTANIELGHQGNSTYSLDMALGGLNLARYANERLGGPEDMTGTVSGRLALSGTAQSTQSLNGRGELHVVDAKLYELPVLVAMLKVLQNRAPDTSAFNRCDMQFAVQGDRIYFQQLNLLGDALSLYGKGETNFDRKLDLVFYTLLEPANLPIPLWKTIAGQVSQQALQLKVGGKWDKADVEVETLPGVNQVLEQIQSGIQAGASSMVPSTATRDAEKQR